MLLNSGSGCAIINLGIAKQIIFNCIQDKRSEKKPLELKSFSNDTVETSEHLKLPNLTP